LRTPSRNRAEDRNEGFVRSADVVSRRVGGETILVPVRAGIIERRCLFTLNETASRVWKELARRRTVDQLAEALAGEFAVSLPRARADVRRLLRQLRAEGCIRDVEHDAKPGR
jgi:hypothetical protein